MPGSYIPTREGDLSLFVTNFDTLITANPATYGLVAGDAVTIHTYVDTFLTALAAASNPGTKTIVTVADKDGAKAAMLQIVRSYAQQIKANRGVADQDKVSLGLTLNDGTPTPIPAPSTQPIISVIGATPLTHVLRFADSVTPDKRSKPYGSIGLQLWRYVGDTAPTGPEQYEFAEFVTRQPFDSSYSGSQVGKRAWYCARWQTATGLVGPWSAPVSFTICG